MVRIRYMGTKRQLCPYVAEVAHQLPEGPVLDLFSGVCSVASELSKQRNVWTNDALLMPHTIGRTLFCVREGTAHSDECIKVISPHFVENRDFLLKKYAEKISDEEEIIKGGEISALEDMFNRHRHPGNCPESEQERLWAQKSSKYYFGTSLLYSVGYFSLRQSIDIDSLRYAIGIAHSTKLITGDQKLYCLSALCQATSLISNTPGHFAQYLRPNSQNISRIVSQFRRHVFREFSASLRELSAFGTRRWRAGNKAFIGDYMSTITELKKGKRKPAIVYADPPYTSDQYSRFYHVPDAILLGTYPNSVGRGRYPSGRFISDFCLKTRVEDAFTRLAAGVSGLGSSLILSYPENGLLVDAREKIRKILRTYFRKSDIHIEISHRHSSLGASKGHQTYPVREILFVARP